MKRWIFNTIRVIVGITILLLLFSKIGFNEIKSTLLKTNIFAIGLLLVIYSAGYIIDNLKYKLFLGTTRVSFGRLVRYILLSRSIGLITPGKVGQFSMIYFLKKENFAIGTGTAIVLIDKLITLIVVALISILGFFLFFTYQQAWRLVFFLVVIFFFIFLIIFSRRIKDFIKKYIFRKYAEKFSGFSKSFDYYLKKKKQVLMINFILSFVKVTLASLQVYLLIIFFGQRAPFFSVLLITSMVIIAALIPVTMAGLGIREAMAVFLYHQIKISPPIVVSVYLLMVILNYLIAAFILTFSMEEIVKIKKGKNE